VAVFTITVHILQAKGGQQLAHVCALGWEEIAPEDPFSVEAALRSPHRRYAG